MHADVVLDSIGSKLQHSMFCVKRIMSRVPNCVIMLILRQENGVLSVVVILFGMVVLRKGDSAKASSHYFALFCTLKN